MFTDAVATSCIPAILGDLLPNAWPGWVLPSPVGYRCSYCLSAKAVSVAGIFCQGNTSILHCRICHNFMMYYSIVRVLVCYGRRTALALSWLRRSFNTRSLFFSTPSSYSLSISFPSTREHSTSSSRSTSLGNLFTTKSNAIILKFFIHGLMYGAKCNFVYILKLVLYHVLFRFGSGCLSPPNCPGLLIPPAPAAAMAPPTVAPPTPGGTCCCSLFTSLAFPLLSCFSAPTTYKRWVQ